jgi:hypothetical protein
MIAEEGNLLSFFSLSPSSAARGIYKINNSWGFFCAK